MGVGVGVLDEGFVLVAEARVLEGEDCWVAVPEAVPVSEVVPVAEFVCTVWLVVC